MVIIETKEELKAFAEKYKTLDEVLIIPVLSDDNVHPSETDISLLYLSDFVDEYIIAFSHNEAITWPVELLDFINTGVRKYVPNKKSLDQVYKFKNVVDVGMLHWFQTNQKFIYDLNFTNTLFYRQFHTLPNLNRNIPIMKILEKCSKLSVKIEKIISENRYLTELEPFKLYNNLVSDTFSKIESVGLAIDEKKFKKAFPEKDERGEDGMVYTQYNLFTSTGRPSNAFHSVNYAALSPEQRRPFISRFDDGYLVMFDYDAFHLRLIGKLCNYTLPKTSMHEYLAKHYYDTDEVSDYQYDESKKKSFHYLYGEIPDEALSIPFFREAKNLTDRVWEIYKQYKLIQTPLFKRQIDGDNVNSMNPSKAFNYILQSFETEWMVSIMDKVITYLEDYKTELILYTYDSMLFDFSESDGTNVIDNLNDIISAHSMKTKCYFGHDYMDMEVIEL